MRKILWGIVVLGMGVAFGGCSNATDESTSSGSESRVDDGALVGDGSAVVADDQKETTDVKAETKALMDAYLDGVAPLEKTMSLAYWSAANSGKKDLFEIVASAELALRTMHSDKIRYAQIEELMKSKDQLDSLDARSLEVAELAFKGNQLPKETLRAMVELSAEIEQTFHTYRAKLDGEELTNNDLLEMLGDETDSAKRRAMWMALKQVGGEVGDKLVELAKLRNQAAKSLGYENYWDMSIRLQEHDPEQLLAIFAELETLTDEPFSEMKNSLDAEIVERLEVDPDALMPWHYDNPFFQAAPPSSKINLDEFYEKKEKEDIVTIAEKFFDDIGLPIEEVVANSDLYEREGKDQHAFSMSVDRSGDVRTLLNIKPTAEWMDTMLHENGHANYDLYIDPSLPYNLRESAHIFTTEGVAMLLGALAKNPTWMVAYAGADPDRVEEVEADIQEQRRREQLIFCRWTMVMLHFEKALYQDPDQDLNRLWWDLKERYQGLRRPADRDEPDWAAKPHFTIAPVYYHNYMLGELFAAQLRHVLAEMVDHRGPTSKLSFNGRKEFGEFLRDKVFRPGASKPWPEFVEDVTGQPLTAKFYGQEIL